MLNYCRRLLLAIAVIVTSVGCATAPDGPNYAASRAASQPTDKATVYVFRRYAEPTAWEATVQLSGREVTTLGQETFTWVFAQPGKHTIRAVWPALSGQRDSTIEAELQAGKTYYFELVGTSRVAGAVGSAMLFRMGSGLNEVAASTAEATLAGCCRFQKPATQNF